MSITCTSVTCYRKKMAEVKPGRNFVFTWNNPGDKTPVFPDGSHYAYQLEKGESGTLHYQGTVSFAKVTRLSALKKIIPEAHWENRKGTQAEAIAYCTKEDTRVGDPINTYPPSSSGFRNDLAAARKIISTKRSWADVVADDDLNEVLAKYPRWVKEIYNHQPIPLLEGVELRPWQQILLNLLLADPDPRCILWYYDPDGNTGKSWMARYLAINHGACVFSAGKSADIAHALDNPKIVVWDLSRCLQEHVNYGVMEDVKNGVIFSPKYESGTKIFPIPHVVVFANFACPPDKFSVDRIKDMFPVSVETPTSSSVRTFKKAKK